MEATVETPMVTELSGALHLRVVNTNIVSQWFIEHQLLMLLKVLLEHQVFGEGMVSSQLESDRVGLVTAGSSQ